MTVTEGEGRMAAAQSRMLIAYDGSDPAKRAVAFAASMLPGAHAQVVHVFSSMAGSLALVPPPLLATPPPEPEETSAIERHGQEIADDGAELAGRLGLVATAVAADAAGTSGVWSTIVELAEQHAVDLIVVGSRGHSGLRAALLGSVSNGVVHHSRHPVLVVPDPTA